jgi:hypothetical protein
MLSQAELSHVHEALDKALYEFEELMREREWYVTDVTEHLESAIEIIRGNIDGD